MKPHFRAILLTTLLLLTTLPIVGFTGASLTWSAGVISTSDNGSRYTRTLAFDEVRWSVVTAKNAQLTIYRTTNAGGTWDANVVESGVAVGPTFGADSVKGSTLDGYICYFDDSNNKVVVAATHDAGLSWSKATPDGQAANTGQTCAVWAASSSVVGVAYSDGTNSKIMFQKSTDGGGTFGTAVEVLSSCTEGGAFAAMASAPGDVTYAALAFQCATTVLKTCRTTDGGATFVSCTTTATISGALRRMMYVSGTGANTVLAFGQRSTNTFSYFKTSNAGSTWGAVGGSTFTAPTGLSAASDIVLDVYDARNWTAIASFGQGGGLTNGNTYVYAKAMYSSDGGASWAGQEDAYTVVASGSSNAVLQADTCSATHSTTGIKKVWFTCTEQGGTNRFIYGAAPATFGTSSAIGATATATVTNLVGLDLDRLGTNLIARTNGGSTVRTYDPLSTGTLAEIANEDTLCTRAVPRIFAQHVGSNALVAYVKCASGGDPTHLYVRTGSLSVPASQQLNGASTGAASIALNVGSQTFAQGGDDLGAMDEIASFPIDYTSNTPNGAGGGSWRLAWGWTSSAIGGSNVGLAGVNSFTDQECGSGCTDQRRTSFVSYGGSNPLGYCTGVDGATPYMAVAGNSGTKTYVLSPFYQTYNSLQAPALNFTITIQSARSTPSGHVSCGSGLVSIQETNQFTVMHRNGTVLATIPMTGASKCDALGDFQDGHGQFIAYCNTTGWEIRQLRNATGAYVNTLQCNGTFGGTVGGSIIDGVSDRTSQNYYVGNTTKIFRFQTGIGASCVPQHSTTGGTVNVIPPKTTPTPTGGLGNGGIFGTQEASAVIPGVSGFGANMFFGMLIVAGVAFGVFVWSRAIAGAAIGAALGVFISWGLGFFGGGTVFGIIILCGGIVFLTRGR